MKGISVANVTDAVKFLANNEDMSITKWIEIEKFGDRQYALVFGWVDGYEKTSHNSKTERGTCRICGKLAYNDSYIKEYDMDWIMPSYKGNVYDTETTISLNKADISSGTTWWAREWKHMRSLIVSGECK